MGTGLRCECNRKEVNEEKARKSGCKRNEDFSERAFSSALCKV